MLEFLHKLGRDTDITMVPVSDGNSENGAHVWSEFVIWFHLGIFLNLDVFQRTVPSNISTMDITFPGAPPAAWETDKWQKHAGSTVLESGH